jgi:hypothetical protein
VTPENAGEAQHSFEQALAMDPESVDARVGIATVFTDNVINKPSFRAKRASGVGGKPEAPDLKQEPLLGAESCHCSDLDRTAGFDS